MAINKDVHQRDVYLLPYPFNNGNEDHPFIVLSSNEANKHENTFVAVMITSMAHRDDFSFLLSDSMFEKPLRKQHSHARMHLITIYIEREIIGTRINTIKEAYFSQMMQSIRELVFNYSFKKL